FNTAAAIPRVTATFQRDTAAVLFSLLLAIAPIPTALVARNFVSLYAIPSASMDPTLRKGDVLLVEKLPNVFGRTSRGDIVLFRPPLALQDIINGGSSSSTNRPTSANSIGSKSLFVKRVVGLPGDINILLDPTTKEISIDGSPAVGPDRNLCEDEPLRLIDRFLETGKGKSIEQLSSNEVFVLGDCKDVSIDSRVFGVLPKDNIEGKPLGRIWPPSRI
ncbi:LexA/Signal peptidase, partial [Fragilariopsis cylindrus CCMP1102]